MGQTSLGLKEELVWEFVGRIPPIPDLNTQALEFIYCLAKQYLLIYLLQDSFSVIDYNVKEF